jgi:hypothetical protein
VWPGQKVFTEDSFVYFFKQAEKESDSNLGSKTFFNTRSKLANSTGFDQMK